MLCFNKLCSQAKAFTWRLQKILTPKHENHTHADNHKQIQRQIVGLAAIRTATEDISSRPWKIYYGVLKNMADIKETLNVIYKNFLKGNVYKARGNEHPQLPAGITDVHSAVHSTS